MNDRIDQGPAAFLDRLERAATRTETPCGDGKMVWRLWGTARVLVLFHGGAGSWRHWAHNIDVLSRDYRLLVPDLPGLGESAFPPAGDDAAQVAAIVAAGIDTVLGRGCDGTTSRDFRLAARWRVALPRCMARACGR